MKKSVFFVAVVFLFLSSANAQTTAQRSLINSFFRNNEIEETISMFHPTCDYRGITVTSISDNTVYISAIFVDNGFFGSGKPFTCTLSLRIDDIGRFTTLRIRRCGNYHDDDGIFECGDGVGIGIFIKQGMGELLETDHPAVQIQEELKRKKLSQFSGLEIICAALFTIWYDEGFYWRY